MTGEWQKNTHSSLGASKSTFVLIKRKRNDSTYSDLRDISGCLPPVELQEQLERAMRLEEERRRAEQEAARLETERMEAIIAKEELARQAEDQLRSQEQLVRAQSRENYC